MSKFEESVIEIHTPPWFQSLGTGRPPRDEWNDNPKGNGDIIRD